MDDDGYIDKELKVSPRKQCPTYCSTFKCFIDDETNGKCRNECSKLDLTNSLICEICEHDCSKERKIVLLDTKYFDAVKKNKEEKVSKKVDDIKGEYRLMEIRLTEIRDEFHKTPSWMFWVRSKLQAKSGKLRNEMKTYIQLMNKMGIEYDQQVEL